MVGWLVGYEYDDVVGWLVGYGDDIFDCIEDVVGWEELSITAVVSFGLLIIPNTHKPPK